MGDNVVSYYTFRQHLSFSFTIFPPCFQPCSCHHENYSQKMKETKSLFSLRNSVRHRHLTGVKSNTDLFFSHMRIPERTGPGSGTQGACLLHSCQSRLLLHSEATAPHNPAAPKLGHCSYPGARESWFASREDKTRSEAKG